MPIAGSVLGNLFPFGTPKDTTLFPSLATLRPVTKTVDTTGQTKTTFADSVDSQYVNIPCRKAPLILIRPQDQESDTRGIQKYNAKSQVNLAKFISLAPEVLAQWQIKVDGIVYQILSVEFDGSSVMTRLMVSDTLPFGY